MLWDHRPGSNRFAGIVLQEYSAEERSARRRRGASSSRARRSGFTEAPHLYKRDGYYYLVTAEGGTGWNHAVTMARSRIADRPVRAASGHPHPERAPPSRRRAAARRPRRPRRDPERRDLHGLSLRPAAAEPRPLHARPRDGDPADAVGEDGWLRTLDGEGCRRSRSRRRICPPHRVSRRAARDDFDAAECCRSTSSGCARRGPTSSSA